jgi:hypothetical protein
LTCFRKHKLKDPKEKEEKEEGDEHLYRSIIFTVVNNLKLKQQQQLYQNHQNFYTSFLT